LHRNRFGDRELQMRTSAAFCAATVFWNAAASASAEDVIIVATGKEGRGRSRIAGQILDYTGQGLRLMLPSGREQTFASDRVVEVETAWQPDHAAGDRLFGEGKYAQALPLYRQSLGKEHRPWARRRILAQCVWCCRCLEQWEQAGDAFLVLYDSDPSTQYFASIPLAWGAAQLSSASVERRAADWLARPDSRAASLLGASWLLTTASRQDASEAVLQRLASDRDARIAFLAESQLWRTRAATAAPQADHWRERIEQMPEDLRPGPYFTYGRALARLGCREQAALAFLRVPILYPSHRDLAAESLLAAGRELELSGQVDEAVGLYREVTADYCGAAAATARSRLENLHRLKTD
jgi:tetratricopeptide (TPR) repeat protein